MVAAHAQQHARHPSPPAPAADAHSAGEQQRPRPSGALNKAVSFQSSLRPSSDNGTIESAGTDQKASQSTAAGLSAVEVHHLVQDITKSSFLSPKELLTATASLPAVGIGGDPVVISLRQPAVRRRMFRQLYDAAEKSALWKSSVRYEDLEDLYTSSEMQLQRNTRSRANSLLGVAFDAIIFLAIIFATTALCVETLPELYEDTDIFRVFDVIFISIFSCEYIIRMWLSRDPLATASEPLFVIDLLAIMPFYIEEILDGSAILGAGLALLRVIRLLRVFRVFKLTRFFPSLRVFGTAMIESGSGLLLLGTVLAAAMIVLSTLIYYAERGTFDPSTRIWYRDNGSRSPFQSIPDSFWWCLTTLTTTGYGDDVPITVHGRIIAALTMVAGTCAISIPTAIIGTNFIQLWEIRRMRRDLQFEYDRLVTELEQRVLERTCNAQSTDDLENVNGDSLGRKTTAGLTRLRKELEETEKLTSQLRAAIKTLHSKIVRFSKARAAGGSSSVSANTTPQRIQRDSLLRQEKFLQHMQHRIDRHLSDRRYLEGQLEMQLANAETLYTRSLPTR